MSGEAHQSRLADFPPKNSAPDLGTTALETLLDSGKFLTAFAVGNQPMTMLSDYVKTAEAAEILGLLQNTLQAWAEAGKIPVHRNPANGYRLLKRKDFAAFLKRVEATVKKLGTR